MRRKTLPIIAILFLGTIVLLSACAKQPDDSTPIEPANPDNPTETIADRTWPEEKLTDIPQPKGKIVLVYQSEGTEDIPAYTLVQFKVANKEEALEYFNQLKNLGYTIETENNDDEAINLEALKDGNRLSFAYLQGQDTASVKYENAK